MDISVDAMLMQAMEELEVVAKRKRDLEGFVLICTEYRRAGRPANALAQVVVPRGMSSAPPLVDEVGGGRGSHAERTRRPGVDLADRDLSLVDAAAKVLRHFGRPMRARQIAETMREWGYPYEKSVDELRASVGGVLARAVREQDGTFTKGETRGVFGLREWGVSNSPAPDDGEDEQGAGEDVHESIVEDTGRERERSLFTSAGDVEMD